LEELGGRNPQGRRSKIWQAGTSPKSSCGGGIQLVHDLILEFRFYYFFQQWARVASLLNRKSAKQCKARWHEWLDPSVRKVEWSREEEEKLLHLAKLMPAQWKTIGPLVGRTATQCQEHYEKLLDDAAGVGKEDDTDQLRSQPLRVGQIDSHPETKPARPDPIDMDEDEIEMLQEARARLANTQGKKAKRKAREKMLEQAKRLSELQKRRELKQAGLLSSQAKKQARKKNRDIDLGVEIPFHKPAPAGFHDVSSEAARSETLRNEKLKSINFKKINEQQYRSRDREAAQAKKREEARLRTLERSNMQYVVAEVSKKNDPLNIRKRGPLELPEPSVTDQELKQIAKMESAASALPDAIGGGSDVTQALLADYSSRPLPTPMRTPMISSGSVGPSKQESILRQASNLRMLERGQTPLLGGETDELEEEEEMGDDDDGDKKPAAHPSSGTARVAAAASVSGRAPTPRRDHYGLNRPQSELRGGGAAMDDSASVGASTFATSAMSIREIAREERRATKRARIELEAALAALPAPQYEYELEAPMDVDEAETQVVVETIMEEDAADVEAAERKRLAVETERLYEARSSVVKRTDLPRPAGMIPQTSYVSDNPVERTIDDERWNLLRHDAHAFPVDSHPSLKHEKKKKKGKTAVVTQSEFPPEAPLDPIPEQFLNEAKTLILTEMENLMNSYAEKLLTDIPNLVTAKEVLLAETAKFSNAPKSESVFTGVTHVPVTEESEMTSLALEFDTLQDSTLALMKKNEKVESKLAVLTGGLAKRAQGVHVDLLHMYGELQNAKIEHAVYSQLQSQEELGTVRRMDDLRERIRRLQQNEAELYSVYQELMGQRGGGEGLEVA
jgi:pre-mRNA-splicing factor CDC5/CEF1